MMNLTIDKDKAVELPSDLAHRGQVDSSASSTRWYADVTRQHRPVRARRLAAAKLNDFIWENFCDWYIEIDKDPPLHDQADENAQKVLCYVLSETQCKLLHPFMPFITEDHLAGAAA